MAVLIDGQMSAGVAHRPADPGAVGACFQDAPQPAAGPARQGRPAASHSGACHAPGVRAVEEAPKKSKQLLLLLLEVSLHLAAAG